MIVVILVQQVVVLYDILVFVFVLGVSFVFEGFR